MFKSVYKDVFIYTASNLLNAAIPFLLLPVLTGVLSPEQFGSAAIFTLVVSIYAAVTGLSLHGAVAVRYVRNQDGIGRYLTSGLVSVTLSLSVVFALSLLCHDLLVTVTHLSFGWICFAALASVLISIVQVRTVLWQYQRKPIRYGVFQIAQSCANAGLSIFFVVFVKMGWEGRALGVVGASILAAFVSVVSFRKEYRIGQSYSGADLKEILKYGLPLIPHRVASLVAVSIDRLMIANIMNTAAVGIYMAGFQVSLATNLIVESIHQAYSPWLMAKLGAADIEVKRKLVGITYLYCVFMLAVATIITVSTPLIFQYFIGEKFRSALEIMPWLVFGFVFSGMYYMVSVYIVYTRRTMYLSIVTVIGAIVKVGLNVVLIKANGIIGAAQAFFIAQVVVFLGTWCLSNRTYSMPWFRPRFAIAGLVK